MAMIVAIFPNSADNGRPYGAAYDSWDEMCEDVSWSLPIPVAPVPTNHVMVGNTKLCFFGDTDITAHPADTQIENAIIMGFDSMIRYDWARLLDSSWGFEQYAWGEMEDESGQYLSVENQHKEWARKVRDDVRRLLELITPDKGQV